MRYLLADTVGSTSTVLSSTGTVLESEKYYPYGGLRSGGISLTDKKFTGQQDEGTAFGLYDYGARFYSTVTGRFTSADPVAAPGDPQMIDRYAYTRDNPLRYTDPTGHFVGQPGCDSAGSCDLLYRWTHGVGGQRSTGSGTRASSIACDGEECRYVGSYQQRLAAAWSCAAAGGSAAEFNRILSGDTTLTKGDRAVKWALLVAWLGAKYHMNEPGDPDPKPKFYMEDGIWYFDCSAVPYMAYGMVGVDLAQYTQTQYDNAKEVEGGRSGLLPGDLVFYEHTYGIGDRWTHVAMYVGNGNIVVADEAGGVHVARLDQYYLEHLSPESYRRPY